MTYNEINELLKNFYKETKVQPGYLILPYADYLDFVQKYNVDIYDPIFTIATKYGRIYLEGREDVQEPIILES
jgi:hypothetical protein